MERTVGIWQLAMNDLQVIVYDEYFDIPLRGIAQNGGKFFAFIASALQDEDMESGQQPGTPAKMRVFDCSQEIVLLFQEKDRIFRDWRLRFDSGESDTASHPLYEDPA